MSGAPLRLARLAAGLFALAAAALALEGREEAPFRVLLRDESRSVACDPPEAPPFPGEEVEAEIPFGGEGTDIGAAIGAALARIPPGARGEILLATDGRSTEGDPAPALAEARRRGVAIRVEPRGAGRLPARAAAVEAPAAVRPGDRFPVSVTVTGSPGGALEVLLEDPAAGGAERRLVVVPEGGRARAVFEGTARVPGVRRFRCGDAGAAVLVEGRGAILRVGRGPAHPGVARLVRDLGGGDPVDGDLASADLTALDGVVLDDLPESALPDGAGERLRAAVEGGLGLVVLGGPSTLGPGGFAGRPIEEALPVRCAPARPRPLLVLAVDVSGSMEIAAAAARAAATLLARRLPSDARLALVFFHDAEAGAAGPFDLADPGQRDAAAREAGRVRPAGGGTRFAAAAAGALAAAARAAGPGERRLLVVTDGRPSEDPGELRRIAASLGEARFLVRVVAVGGDPDPERLRAFAGEEGVSLGGPGDLADRLGSLSGGADPGLFVAVSTAVRAGPDVPPFGAVPSGLPAVAGYDRVFPREGARVWLALAGGEPLLAARRIGLGRSVVFAAAPGAGQAEWTSEPAAGWLRAALGWTLRAPGAEGAEARAIRRRDGTLDLRLEREFPFGALPGREVRGAGAVLARTGPGTWEGRVPAEAAGEEGVVVFESGGAPIARAAAGPGPSPEDLHRGPDAAALAALAVPGRGPGPAGPGAGPAALAAALAALALLLGAAALEAGPRARGPTVPGGGGVQSA